MKRYRIKESDIKKDAHGQPICLFKANADNNVSKAIDQLAGICAGILADGTVNDAEALFFANWVRKYASYEPVWPFTDILERIERIFSDGICDPEEREELTAIMKSICGQNGPIEPDETYSASFPLDSPQPEPLLFEGRRFNITGRFAFGTRAKVMEAISKQKGVPSDDFPTLASSYIVIGTFASRDWINTNYGRKIERAAELRSSGSGIAIISEEHWRQFISLA